jgi:hypothetical protein
MFETRKRPRRRDDQSVGVLFGNQLSVHLRKSKVVANAEAKAETSKSKARECIARSKPLLFFNRRDCIQVSLAIFRENVALLIDKNLGIVNAGAIAL